MGEVMVRGHKEEALMIHLFATDFSMQKSLASAVGDGY